MADNKLLQQMLESLVNDDQAKAEELFHEYVVTKSREIYESLIDSEISEEAEDDEEDEEMDEAAKSEKEEDEEDLDENFEEVAIEGDDEMDLDSEDPTDDLAGELGGEEEPAEKGEEELFQDLEAIVDELQAKFDELKGIESDEHGDEFGGEMGDEEDEQEEGFELETVREYVEKVADGHGAEKKGKGEEAGVNAQSLKFSKNDMGGTSANILRTDTENGVEANKGQLQGSSLTKQKPQDMNTGNINVPGGKAGKTSFTKKEPGHGAEKAGSKESADNKQSLFRGRR